MRLRTLLLGALLITALSQPGLKSDALLTAATTKAPSGRGATLMHQEVRPVVPPAIAPRALAVGSSSSSPSNAFLTLPYVGFHWITSIFDHCNPDYSTDGKICEFDGTVALKSNGVAPDFSLGYATSPGGTNYLYYDGHNGWDLGLNYENILAAADGTVRIAGIDSVNPCFGQNVVIDHPNGLSTRYGHMSQIYVSQGQSVTRGQVLGLSGNTGCSTGPHLHFGVYITGPWTAIDPYGWAGAPGADPWPSDVGDLWMTGSAQYPVPGAPTGVTATAGNATAAVSWTAPTWTGGVPVVSYTVTPSAGGPSVTVPGTQTTASVSGLTNGTTYSFTVTGGNADGMGPASAASNAVMPTPGGTIYYFAEGYTGAGFTESLALVMPNQSGSAIIDYYTQSAHQAATQALTAGQVATVDVNAAVGPNQQVAIRVMFTGLGLAQRSLHYNFGSWYGSEDTVGATKPATEWDFAEGSTYNVYSEYLTLQNPNPDPVTVDLNYFTDGGAHPVKTLTLQPTSRATVQVFSGDLSNNASCIANNAGANCGVGSGIGGVSVQVKSRSEPIVAERPMYVDNYSFGWGAIRDGHVAFGANAPATRWIFAEGTTIAGFNEYLTIENPGASAAAVSISYLDGTGTTTGRSLTVGAQTRSTVPVFDPTLGVGRGDLGVSATVQSNQPIVVERPIYMVHDFGSGTVAGADDVLGATSLGTQFQFVRASTASGEWQFLTIANPQTTAANVTLTYFTGATPVVKTIVVPAANRFTVLLFDATSGPGRVAGAFRIAVASDQPILVERPAYSTNGADYGASDTMGISVS